MTLVVTIEVMKNVAIVGQCVEGIGMGGWFWS